MTFVPPHDHLVTAERIVRLLKLHEVTRKDISLMLGYKAHWINGIIHRRVEFPIKVVALLAMAHTPTQRYTQETILGLLLHWLFLGDYESLLKLCDLELRPVPKGAWVDSCAKYCHDWIREHRYKENRTTFSNRGFPYHTSVRMAQPNTRFTGLCMTQWVTMVPSTRWGAFFYSFLGLNTGGKVPPTESVCRSIAKYCLD